MTSGSRISKAFVGAPRLPLNTSSHYVIFSDCHRGTGNANDNFLINEHIYLAALKYYFSKNFTYVELGDGDELWENSSMDSIKKNHPDSFGMLARFYENNRFFAVYGNHDIAKNNSKFCKKHFHTYYCHRALCERPLFPNIQFYSGIILEDENKKSDIYLTHGHQASSLNSTFWPLSCFLVRYVWKPLELLGIPDPTSAAKNNSLKKRTEQHLTSWVKKHNHILITGHTHRAMTGSSEVPFFNTGSCVSPGGITCIEIRDRCIKLVKWSLGTKENLELFVEREVLGNSCFILD